MIRSYEGVHEDDTTAVLELGAKIIDESGIVEALKAAAEPVSGRGRPAELRQYDARAVLIAVFELAYSTRLVSITNLLSALWFRYTDEQMELIGLPAWRDADRAARIKRHSGVHRNEYGRLSTFFTRMLAPIDDTPVTAHKRLTNREFKAATANPSPELVERRQRRDVLLNRIVAATIDRSLFEGYQGHLAVDEHNVFIALYDRPTRVDPDAVRGGNPMSDYTPKHRRSGHAWAIGLTGAVSVYRPGQPPVPRVAFGIGFDPPSAASIEAALTAIDAAEANGLIPAPTANQHKWFVGDMAYNIRHGFNAALLERGWSQLMDYPTHWGTVHDLWQDRDTDGPRLVNGVVICPGIPGPVARALKLKRLPDNASSDAIHRRALDLHRIQAATMPTNGRPVRTIERGRGRPRKDAPPAEAVYKLKVQCPAECKKIRCALVPKSMNLDAAKFPMTSPPANPPTACQRLNSTVIMTEQQFKQYSPLMAGSFEHDDFYRHARSHNENYFSRLTSETGGALRDRKVVQRRNSGAALVIAFGVAVTNIKEQAAWRQRIRRNDGHVPVGTRTRRAAARRRALRALDRKAANTQN